MKLLIPSDIIEVTGDIQQCLLLAEQQGFAIEHIELGISPTRTLQLISNEEHFVVATDLLDKDQIQTTEYHCCLCYLSAASIESFTMDSRKVFIHLNDSNGDKYDVWTNPLNQQRQALRVTEGSLLSRAAMRRHLVWFITLSALSFPLEDSLTLARAMLNVSRETWAFEYCAFPTPVLEHKDLDIRLEWQLANLNKGFPKLEPHSLGLYPVVDSVEWIEKLLPLGIKTIQLRIKQPERVDLEAQIIRAIELGREYNAQVFINDYWQLAIKHGAFGVHLGQEDLQASNLTQLAGAGIALGLSTHGYYELLRIVQLAPSYIALGHIFPTTTKQMPSQPQGLTRLALYQKLIDTIPYGEQKGIPTVAIGGIDLGNASQVWQTGVTSLAVVRAITQVNNVQRAIGEFKEVMVSNSEQRSCAPSLHYDHLQKECSHVE
ncbi:thiamine-phosphate diphosphorylase [Vibrio navarrensis]|uniref:Thiamine-phosphate synthase n=1 Tax=Vibrio navarrensis TaxID=29495 RepID=A0AAJ4LUI6_9VIBR|nr:MULTISPECIES: thiamine phosphate synthase [Vibrio]KJR37588.1 thiamine-phosphate pyrophosphorylase [Vibrio sp. S234-5]MBE3662938.1 thiamine-phosphate diphosphorylase [Vibrio navarrensis]MBE4605548.1 thiamine-phosphate diphosphorylase [Vibrio navarrensis]QPL53559.1 thiamine phosphate synthase [Vibrio navarrensis]